MKKTLKKIGAIACALFLIPYAVNANTDEKLYEKYGNQRRHAVKLRACKKA